MQKFDVLLSSERLLFNPKTLSSDQKRALMAKFYSSLKRHSMDLVELASKIESGYPFLIGLFEYDKPTVSNFKQSSCLVLDMDEMPCSHIDFLSRLNKHGLVPNIYYKTPSFTDENPRYRYIFLLDTVVTHEVVLRNYLQGLARHFGGDLAVNSSKMWQPCIQGPVEILSKEPNVVSSPFFLSLIDKIVNPQTNKEFSHTYKRKFFREIENSIVVSNKSCIVPRRNFNFELVASISPVFKGFFEGTGHLKYVQLRNLITNMMHVSGGLKMVKQKMNESGTYNESDYALLRLPVWLGKKNRYYSPERIDTFDPSLSEKYKNILDIDTKRSDIKQLKPVEKVEIGEAYEQFEHNFTNWVQSTDETMFTCIKGAYGLGKTEMLVKLLAKNKDNSINYIIGFKTHKLLNEFAEKLDKLGILYAKTPPPIRFPHNPDLEEIVYAYYKAHDFNNVRKLFTQILRGTGSYTKEDADIVANYRAQLTEAAQAKLPLLTTHARVFLGITGLQKTRPLILDEDIWRQSLPISAVSVKHLFSVLEAAKEFKIKKRNMSKFYSDVDILVSFYKSLIKGQIVSFLGEIVFHDYDQLVFNLGKIKGSSLILKLITAQYICLWSGDEKDAENFVYSISYIKPQSTSKKLILSASADSWLHKQLEPTIDFIDTRKVRNQTPIVQFTDKSYFKTSMRKGKYPDIPSNSHVITYKDMPVPEQWQIQSDIHFFNSSGSNVLEKKDIYIVGTPIMPTVCTLLIHKCLGLPKPTSYEKTYRKVELEDKEFNFFTFKDENLAQIELRLCKMEIEQSSGRSRSIRNRSAVTISNTIKNNPYIVSVKIPPREFESLLLP